MSEISNRFVMPPDGWVQMVPKGEFPWVNPHDRREELIQVVDASALADLKRTFPAELFIDQDHLSGDIKNATTAMGWVSGPDSVQIRADGLYAKPKWSDAGLANIHGGNLRYVSPVFDRASLLPLGRSVSTGLMRYRVTRLIEAGLTNRPNLKGMKPISGFPLDDEEILDAAGVQNTAMREAFGGALKNNRQATLCILRELGAVRGRQPLLFDCGEFSNLSGIDRAKAAFAADIQRCRRKNFVQR